MPTEKVCCLHWLSFTLPYDITDDELDKICLELFGYSFKTDFQKGFSIRNAYFNWFTLNPSDKLVTVYRNGIALNKGTTFFEVSGMGLDTLPKLDVLKVGQFIKEHGGNITRIDLALDDLCGVLPFNEIKELSDKEVYKDRIVSHFNRTVPVYSKQISESVRFGSSKGKNGIIIYKKNELEGVTFPWTRVEIKIRNREDCMNVMNDLLDGKSLGAVAAGTLRYYLLFKPVGMKPKARRPTLAWWEQFLGDVAKRKLGRSVKQRVTNEEQDLKLAASYLSKALGKNKTGIEQMIIELAESIQSQNAISNW
jgi:DNA relaxase NicK